MVEGGKGWSKVVEGGRGLWMVKGSNCSEIRKVIVGGVQKST